MWISTRNTPAVDSTYKTIGCSNIWAIQYSARTLCNKMNICQVYFSHNICPEFSLPVYSCKSQSTN